MTAAVLVPGPPRPGAEQRRHGWRQEHRHHERRDGDAARDREAHLLERGPAGQDQRCEGPGQDHPRRGDRRPGVLERLGRGLPRGLALGCLLPQARHHQDVVVGAQRHHEQVHHDRQDEGETALVVEVLENADRGAQGGTLLLDEVTEMPLDMQTRLLRVLETRKYYRVGASTEYSSDVRVIAATNRCPLQAVQNGNFREDLLYRLAVFPVHMPPLRSRGDDVALLAEHFLAELNAQARSQKRLSALARMTLKQHPWPGNVRELKNCIERAFILGDTVLELAPLIQGAIVHNGDSASDRERLDIRVGSRIHDMERSLIEATLDYFKGNKRRAADALGCSLKTLYNKLNGYSQSQECANS